MKHDCHVFVNKNVKIPANQLGRKCALAEWEVLTISAHKITEVLETAAGTGRPVMSAADAHNFTPEKRNFMLFTRCTVSHLHTNNKHRVILHSVLSKMPITTVAHNKDTCSRHPTDGCYLRPAVITQHCSRCPNTALRCLQRSVTSCRQLELPTFRRIAVSLSSIQKGWTPYNISTLHRTGRQLYSNATARHGAGTGTFDSKLNP